MLEASKYPQIGLSLEDRRRRARYLGALADRVFYHECARLGLNVDEVIKYPLSSIIIRQCRRAASEEQGTRG